MVDAMDGIVNGRLAQWMAHEKLRRSVHGKAACVSSRTVAGFPKSGNKMATKKGMARSVRPVTICCCALTPSGKRALAATPPTRYILRCSLAAALQPLPEGSCKHVSTQIQQKRGGSGRDGTDGHFDNSMSTMMLDL